MMIMPYLSFGGNCEEAFLWYANIFGGSVSHMSKYSDMPSSNEFAIPDEHKNKVMHAQLTLGDNCAISGADSLAQVQNGGAVSIHAHIDDESVAQSVFSALSEDGMIISTLTTNPPPDDSGMSGCVRDKYGFVWIISTMKAIK